MYAFVSEVGFSLASDSFDSDLAQAAFSPGHRCAVSLGPAPRLYPSRIAARRARLLKQRAAVLGRLFSPCLVPFFLQIFIPGPFGAARPQHAILTSSSSLRCFALSYFLSRGPEDRNRYLGLHGPGSARRRVALGSGEGFAPVTHRPSLLPVPFPSQAGKGS